MHFIFDAIKIALRGLLSNRGRALLTMLGVIIGITSVIVIMSVGEGAQSLILGEIKSMGSNLIGVLPGNTGKDGPPASVMGIVVTTLNHDDALAIADKRNTPHVAAVSAFAKGFGPVIFQRTSIQTTYSGTSASYPVVQDHDVYLGRYFNESEVTGTSKVAVLGYQVWEDLFEKKNPIGEKIKIGSESFRVIGVMTNKGSGGLFDFNDQVYAPVTTIQKLVLGINYINFIRVKVDAATNVDSTIVDVENLLRRRHKIKNPKDDDFTVSSQSQALGTISTVTSGLQFFLASVAAISLIVGGIGIMNIMLIAVSERTREIGLRKAIGAKQNIIMTQFLVEAVVITVTGAIIGIIIGVAISFSIASLMSYLEYNWEFKVTLLSIFLSVGVAMIVGLLFGLYPAKKASMLKPIEALRYE